MEGPRTWRRRAGLLGGLEGQPLIAEPAWGWGEERAFAPGVVSFTLLQIQIYIKLFTSKSGRRKVATAGVGFPQRLHLICTSARGGQESWQELEDGRSV